MRNAHELLIGEPIGNRPLARSSRRWEGNFTLNFRKIELNDFSVNMAIIMIRRALLHGLSYFTHL